MAKKPSPDRAYLIRCWQESDALPDAPRWRFSVEEVSHEGQRWGFKDLDTLVAFLRAELGDNAQLSSEQHMCTSNQA
jgi:hypothetical protein